MSLLTRGTIVDLLAARGVPSNYWRVVAPLVEVRRRRTGVDRGVGGSEIETLCLLLDLGFLRQVHPDSYVFVEVVDEEGLQGWIFEHFRADAVLSALAYRFPGGSP